MFVLFSFIKSSFAITPNIDNNYNFGTFTQTNSNASFVLSYDGIMSSISNLSQSGTPTAGKITYTSEQNGDNLTFTSTTSTYELNGCTLTFSNITPSTTDIVLNPGQGKTRTVTFGVNVNISGFCEKGSYEVSGVAINANASKTGSNTAYIPFVIVFNEHIEIIQTQEMNFGSFWQSSSGGTITVSPDSSYSVSNILMADDSRISAGKFTLSGLINRTIQLSFSNAVLSNGTSTMTANGLNADVGNNFTVTSDKMAISVGGTLNVNANQPYGVYTGSYTLTITY